MRRRTRVCGVGIVLAGVATLFASAWGPATDPREALLERCCAFALERPDRGVRIHMLSYLAAAAARAGLPSTALQQLASEPLPDTLSPETHTHLAVAHWHAGDHARARYHFEEAARRPHPPAGWLRGIRMCEAHRTPWGQTLLLKLHRTREVQIPPTLATPTILGELLRDLEFDSSFELLLNARGLQRAGGHLTDSIRARCLEATLQLPTSLDYLRLSNTWELLLPRTNPRATYDEVLRRSGLAPSSPQAQLGLAHVLLREDPTPHAEHTARDLDLFLGLAHGSAQFGAYDRDPNLSFRATFAALRLLPRHHPDVFTALRPELLGPSENLHAVRAFAEGCDRAGPRGAALLTFVCAHLLDALPDPAPTVAPLQHLAQVLALRPLDLDPGLVHRLTNLALDAPHHGPTLRGIANHWLQRGRPADAERVLALLLPELEATPLGNEEIGVARELLLLARALPQDAPTRTRILRWVLSRPLGLFEEGRGDMPLVEEPLPYTLELIDPNDLNARAP